MKGRALGEKLDYRIQIGYIQCLCLRLAAAFNNRFGSRFDFAIGARYQCNLCPGIG